MAGYRSAVAALSAPPPVKVTLAKGGATAVSMGIGGLTDFFVLELFLRPVVFSAITTLPLISSWGLIPLRGALARLRGPIKIIENIQPLVGDQAKKVEENLLAKQDHL